MRRFGQQAGDGSDVDQQHDDVDDDVDPLDGHPGRDGHGGGALDGHPGPDDDVDLVDDDDHHAEEVSSLRDSSRRV